MLNYQTPLKLDFVQGDATGMNIPAHAEALRDAGPGFLTEAFHRFGSLPSDNRVVRITHLESFAGGNSGHKVLMTVEYAHAAPGLHTELFVKFSRDFSDGFRDRRRLELEAEVHLATLSRLPAFPISVPIAYFTDFNHESGTGLLITQRITFGRDGIEPLRAKCMDHELDNPLEYYRAIVITLARLIAAHKAGRLSPLVEQLFPFDVDTAVADIPIPWNEAELHERVQRYIIFAARCPQLLPENVRTPMFFAHMERDAKRLLQHEQTIKRFLASQPDFIALCHWNTNIDNAWFWRDEHGVLQAGLLDWGMVRQMNVATALWGGLCSASLEIWNHHLDELLTVFITELHANGGPLLDMTQLKLNMNLSAAMLGIAMMMDVPAWILERLPDAVHASNTLDPIMHRDEIARSFLHVFTAFLNRWQTQDFGACVEQVLSRAR